MHRAWNASPMASSQQAKTALSMLYWHVHHVPSGLILIELCTIKASIAGCEGVRDDLVAKQLHLRNAEKNWRS